MIGKGVGANYNKCINSLLVVLVLEADKCSTCLHSCRIDVQLNIWRGVICVCKCNNKIFLRDFCEIWICLGTSENQYWMHDYMIILVTTSVTDAFEHIHGALTPSLYVHIMWINGHSFIVLLNYFQLVFMCVLVYVYIILTALTYFKSQSITHVHYYWHLLICHATQIHHAWYPWAPQ